MDISEILRLTGGRSVAAVGSRITCSPAPSDTDEDWLVLIRTDTFEKLEACGFKQEGSPKFYTVNDKGEFRSWRHGDVNIITTKSVQFFELFLTATALAKRFNLLNKVDRIALFQAVLYGVRFGNLNEPYVLPTFEA
jgi:hypothetical protein